MKLYSGPLSLFTAKVRIALAEKQIPYERIEVGWSLEDRYLPHHPDVVALNPRSQVPVLVDGDVVVYDSTLVLEYLEERAPEPPLYPPEIAERARCRQLEATADEEIFPFVWDLIEEAFYPPPPGGRDPERREKARRGLGAVYHRLEKELSGEWLCTRFSVADLSTFVFVNAAGSLGEPPGEDMPRLRAWLERCRARPAPGAEVAEMQRYLAGVLAARGAADA